MIKPKLRFPEFNGEWEEISLENSTEKIIDYRGKTPNKTDSGIPLITAKIIKDGKIDKATEFISENDYDTWMKRGIPKSGDVLITSEAPLGEVAQLDGSKIALAQRIITLRGKKRLVNNTFLLHILTSPSAQYKIKIKSTGSTVHGIKQKELRKVLLEIPTFSEQEKIASFLSQVDRKIDLLETKQKLWETYKKGIIQQIFSQKIRFKDESGADYPDWVGKKISELFDFLPTNSLPRANLNYNNGNVKNIHYGDIHTKFPTNLDCEKIEIPFINPNISLKKIKSESYCQNGDLIITDASEDYEGIGKAIELKNINNKKVLAGLHTFLARDNSELTVKGFRGYLFLNQDLSLKIKRIATGISVLGISKTNLGRLIVNIPPPDEQKKIASFLSAIDAKLEELRNELEINNEFKKGLLQQMFC